MSWKRHFAPNGIERPDGGLAKNRPHAHSIVAPRCGERATVGRRLVLSWIGLENFSNHLRSNAWIAPFHQLRHRLAIVGVFIVNDTHGVRRFGTFYSDGADEGDLSGNCVERREENAALGLITGISAIVRGYNGDPEVSLPPRGVTLMIIVPSSAQAPYALWPGDIRHPARLTVPAVIDTRATGLTLSTMTASLLLPSNSVLDGRLITQCVHELHKMAKTTSVHAATLVCMIWIPLFHWIESLRTLSRNADRIQAILFEAYVARPSLSSPSWKAPPAESRRREAQAQARGEENRPWHEGRLS